VFLLLFFNLAIASDNSDSKDEKSVVYKQKTEIDFEDLEIEGSLERPSSQLLQERKGAKFNPLIKLRENWDPEMEQSIDEIK
jgi:hypothetical protein